MGTETELKLLVDPVSLLKLAHHPLVEASKDGPEHCETLISVYFDTPDLRLMSKKIALRIRKIGGRFIQTIKTAPIAPGDSWTRGEWEAEVNGETPDLSLIEDDALSAFFTKRIAKGLTPLFRTEIDRTWFQLKTPDAEIELALDQGKICAGADEEHVSEVELELKSGNPLALFHVALRLSDKAPLRLSMANKAKRGYRLALKSPPAPVKASKIELAPELSTKDAFQRIAQSCLEQIIGNLDCLDAAPSSEAIHQLRIGVRRLRTVFSIFSPKQPDEETKTIRTELAWLQGALANARESSVFVHDFLDPIRPAMGEDQGFLGLYSDFETKKQESHDDVEDSLDPARLSLLLLRAACLIERGGGFADMDDVNPISRVGRFAETVIKKRTRPLQKALPSLVEQDIEARHQTRIAVKKLRYALEFFTSIHLRGKFGEKIRILAKLQDQLGLLNDIADGEERLKDYAKTCSDEKRVWAAGLIAGLNRTRRDQLIRQASQSAKAFLKILKA